MPVTLTVADDLGLTATLTQQATWDVATALVEPLVLAEETLAAATADGEASWRSFVEDVTAVAPPKLFATKVLRTVVGGKTVYEAK